MFFREGVGKGVFYAFPQFPQSPSHHHLHSAESLLSSQQLTEVDVISGDSGAFCWCVFPIAAANFPGDQPYLDRSSDSENRVR